MKTMSILEVVEQIAEIDNTLRKFSEKPDKHKKEIDDLLDERLKLHHIFVALVEAHQELP